MSGQRVKRSWSWWLLLTGASAIGVAEVATGNDVRVTHAMVLFVLLAVIELGYRLDDR